jgi:23S rRNA pseudouridine2457 synthase
MLIRFYKPFGVLCQFRAPDDRPTLANYIDRPRVHPAGRLDFDSEGLLLLTDDGPLQARISEPRHKLPKTYLVQVEAQPAAEAIAECAEQLRRGIPLRDGLARAVSLRSVPPPVLPPRHPEVTPHRAARSSWLEIVLTEGRNRQVRRMLAAVGMPVLRLVRTAIGPIDLADLAPGQWEVIGVPEPLRARERPQDTGTQRRPRARSAVTRKTRERPSS